MRQRLSTTVGRHGDEHLKLDHARAHTWARVRARALTPQRARAMRAQAHARARPHSRAHDAIWHG
eukprot:4572911-Alexandrium_andersonii.AAC.1